MTLRRWGAFAAPVLALLYVAGLVLSTTLLDTAGIADPLERTRFQVEHRAALSTFVLCLYVLFGALLPLVSLSLRDLLHPAAPDLTRVGTHFAMVWSALLIGSGLVFHTGLGAVAALLPRDPQGAVLLMRLVETIHEGLGCIAEVPGGLWILLLSLGGLRTRTLHPLHAWTGVATGTAGILSVVPSLFVPAVAAYVLGSLAWFPWTGLVLLRSHPDRKAAP